MGQRGVGPAPGARGKVSAVSCIGCTARTAWAGLLLGGVGRKGEGGVLEGLPRVGAERAATRQG